MKTKILSILALLLMTVTQGAWAQETLTVYDGTADNRYSPMNSYIFDNYTKCECIIPASELTAMEGGTITAITFYARAVATQNAAWTNTNQKVFLKEVSGTTLSSYSGMTDATVVFDGTLPMPTTSASGYTISFSQGYTYNGGNLLIGVYNDAKGKYNQVRWYGIDNQSSGVSAYGYSTLSPAEVGFTKQTFLPKTTFTYETPPTAVDLGLPSGTRWADMNVGAGSETGYGTYYAWSSSDIATAQWGNDWRMPTLTEAQELINNTDQEWATIGGVNGTKFMKKTDHSVYIFVPAAGWDGSGNGNIGTAGAYWTSTAQNESRAYEFVIRASGNATGNDNMTHQFTVRPVQMFAGEGTQASPYEIASTTDWNNLVTAVNGGETYSGNYFKMTANVGTVSTWMTGTFSGTFDGDGKTLTVGYSATTNNCAPFGYLNGTVQNLKVAGNISTSKQYAGGLAAWVKTGHTANVTNCRVAATINSTYSGDGSSAGFVAYVDGRLNVTGCAFTGTLAGSNAYAWGGFVSYNVGRSDITNCLFAPASVTAKADYSATVGRNGGGTLNFANFYYTQKFNTAQGLQARTIVKGDGVSSLSVTKGSGTTYNVAGITVYSNGVDYNSNFYCGSGQTVSLALTAETRSGYQFTQYAASQGTLSAQTATSATLTMPAANSTANDAVTVTAQYLSGEGTEASPYLIASTTDWNNISAAVNGGETYSGKYFKMTANVGTVSTTVGTSASAFNGTFDGNGHTLNVNISNSNPDTRTAPFAWAGGSAVIKNLHVTGSLTNTARTSGIVGSCYATTQISSCRVSATISGSNHTSGISISGGQITNCLFDGKINGTASTAGFATYVADGTKITNCLFKPQSGSSIPSSQGCFYTSESGKTPTFDNCYYTSTAGGTAQGTDGSGMTAEQLVENLGPSNWKVVDGNAIPKVHPNLAGEGTEDSPYLIASTTDWNNLVSAVNAGETYNGNYFKMTANVDASKMIGSSTETFKGNFDGDGYTLNLNINMTASSSQIAAPFAYVVGGTIKNVKLTGTVNTAGMRSSSLIGYADNCTIRNCTSSVAISSSRNNDVDGGAFVACVIKDKTVTIEGCAFTGSITFSDAAGYEGGGFVGWMRSPSTVTLTNCLFAPSAVSLAKASPAFKMFAYDNAGTTLTLNNCYYNDVAAAESKITVQGLQARSIAKGANVTTLAISGAGTEYDVSGITSYGTGIQYGGVLYGGNEDAVSLTLTAPEHDGYGFVYSADNGTVTGNNNPYTLTMVDANAIINVKYSASKAINKYTSDDTSDGWYLIASPLDGEVEVDEVEHLQDNVYDLYFFDQSREKEWVNYKEHEGNANPGFDLVSGKGYLYANSGDVTLTFIGTPYSGNGEVSLAYSVDNPDVNMRGWNLVGNPFATTATLNKPFYKMNNDGNGLTAKIEDLNTTIAAMEGVFVQATAEGQSATFTAQTSKGGQQAIAKTNIVLSGNKGKVLDNAIIRFDNGETLGKFYFGEQNANLYIPQDAEEYAIATSNGQGEMPLNFKANANGEYTLTVNPENVEMGYLHLIDNMTGADIDLLQTPEYSFSAKATDYESRFRLVFVCGDANDDNGDNETFAFFSNGSWVIANEGEATLQVIDLNGRILSSETVNGSVSKSINQPAGVYMIRLINGENVKVQKVVIE